MLAVIYKSSVYPEREKEFQQVWRKVANYFVTHCGALGSHLHKTENGEWIAYSRWPNKETRDTFWIAETGLSKEIRTAIQTLKSCIDLTKPHEEICMNVIDSVHKKAE
jgi:heme-degrading monooxygenase HmoA